MADQRSSAPTQRDPIRDRLGQPAAARDVRCPNCNVVFDTARRWQMRCPDCDHRWTDRSSRTLLDAFRDADVFSALFLTTVVLSALGSAAIAVISLFGEAANVWGWDHTYGLAAVFLASLVSLIALGRIFRH